MPPPPIKAKRILSFGETPLCCADSVLAASTPAPLLFKK
jgi:hypothetical protein